MKNIKFLLVVVFSLSLMAIQYLSAFTYHWEIGETLEGSESATVVEPIQVIFFDEVIEVPSHSASLTLMQKYSVYLGPEWRAAHAYRLLQTFESIPQKINNPYYEDRIHEPSLWRLTDRHLLNDIDIEYRDGQQIITIAAAAFVNATPLMAEIEGVRGRYFSKRLHRAVVRSVTDNGNNRRALDKILEERYAVSVDVPDYEELTKNTTAEHAGRFEEFKNEELIAIIAMLEEFPTGMLKTPGLKYLVRRLDGTPHPTHPSAAAVAWTGAGYIEFMEIAFNGADLSSIHRLILHEKAHFLWDYLFDEQLQQDWIQIGGWYREGDKWFTTKQTEFVSAYAHGKNPNEDMAESISYYIVNPNKLRSRSPTKYEFIQNRVMHGTRYISKIREDLTFQVYNLYPDYVYPGRIVRVDIQVTGAPEEDKQIIVEIEIHGESDLDTATRGYTRIRSEKGTTYKDIYLHPIDANGGQIGTGHVLQSHPVTLSRYAANGYWTPEQITLTDANGNKRFGGQKDFGFQLHIDNPLADCEPPQYMPNSMQLSLSDAVTPEGQGYQILTAQWRVIEKNDLSRMSVSFNDIHTETYSFSGGGSGERQTNGIWLVTAHIDIPDHYPSGQRFAHTLSMRDIAGNPSKVYFSHYDGGLSSDAVKIDEVPAMIDVQTPNPDTTPPVLDVNNIKIKAEPTRPKDPNGETLVDITFSMKDDISGYRRASLYLRDPHGVKYGFSHSRFDDDKMYFVGDPTVFETYSTRIVLPVGSVPGTWGLANMNVHDKARNTQRYDFTEIVRFEVEDTSIYVQWDVNRDGTVNVLDLVLVANEIGHAGESDIKADVNSDGTVNIQDLVLVANEIE